MILAVGEGDRRFSGAVRLLEEGVRDEVFSAAAFLVSRGEEVLFHASAGDARPDSVFDVASLTKPLVASLFFVLAQEGKLSADMPAPEALPLPFADPAAAGIRLSHLLSHTAGLPAWRPLYEELRAGEEAAPGYGTAEGHDRIVRAALGLPLEYPPGEGCTYSDPGFILLGWAMETAAFLPLDRMLRGRLADPLGMVDTSYLPLARIPRADRGRLVSTGPSVVRGYEKPGEVNDENAAAMGGVAGHAGVFSTAADLFRFSREILRAFRGEGRVLTSHSVRRMAERVASPPGCPRTLGWDTPTAGSQSGTRFTARTIGHLGFTGCSLWIDPEREIAIVLLTNRVVFGAGNRKLSSLRPLLHDAVMEELVP